MEIGELLLLIIIIYLIGVILSLLIIAYINSCDEGIPNIKPDYGFWSWIFILVIISSATIVLIMLFIDFMYNLYKKFYIKSYNLFKR